MICPECGNDTPRFMHEKNCSELRIPQEPDSSLEDRVARLEEWAKNTSLWSDGIVAALESK